MKLTLLWAICSCLLLVGLTTLNAQNTPPFSISEKGAITSTAQSHDGAKIYQFKLHEPIFPAAWRTVQRAIDDAETTTRPVMILTDTGPLIALLDADDRHHQRCRSAIEKLPAEPMLTTWPCFTEAIYLLGSVGGYSYQKQLWNLYTAGRLCLHTSSASEVERMNKLMDTYQDTPMDLADASLVAAAESLSIQQIFSLDSHFYIYRLPDGSVLQVTP